MPERRSTCYCGSKKTGKSQRKTNARVKEAAEMSAPSGVSKNNINKSIAQPVRSEKTGCRRGPEKERHSSLIGVVNATRARCSLYLPLTVCWLDHSFEDVHVVLMILPLESIAFAALFSSRILPLLARRWESPANKEWRERERESCQTLSFSSQVCCQASTVPGGF